MADRYAATSVGGRSSGSSLGNCRRLVVRYERMALNYLGCILVLLRQIA
jgi:hypothetical protein